MSRTRKVYSEEELDDTGVEADSEELEPSAESNDFKVNEFVVYPAHGVGQILAIEKQEIAGGKLEFFVIIFMKEKMTLRVPTAKVANVGMRKLSEPALVKKALETLKGRARVKNTMWSHRAKEYEAKINSGDIVAIAEVVRDLYRSESQPEQSYSETPALRSGTRSPVARNRRGPAFDRDRSGQGNRNLSCRGYSGAAIGARGSQYNSRRIERNHSSAVRPVG